MCLAKPMQLTTIDRAAGVGKVTVAGGELDVGLDLVPEAETGDYVLVHAGMAIEVLDREDADAILKTYEEYVTTEETAPPGAVE